MHTYRDDGRRAPTGDDNGHAVFFIDTDGAIDNWPRTAETVYRYSTDEILGEPFDELWSEPPNQVTGLPELLERATREEVRVRHHHNRGDGSDFLAECTIWPVRNGQLHGHAVVSHDAGHGMRSGMLARLGGERENLVDLFSGRLQSPLQVVSGLLTLYGQTGDERQLERASSTVNRAERLVAGMVDLLGQDVAVGDLVPVDLGPVTTVARQGSVPIDVTFEGGIAPTVYGDAERLIELFYQIFQNSTVHRMDETERVAVRVGSFVGGFYVEDDGPGVSEAIRDAVFDVGFTTLEDRAGFGLTIVQRLAAAHGWTVELGESAIGGTRLTFTGVTLVD